MLLERTDILLCFIIVIVKRSRISFLKKNAYHAKRESFVKLLIPADSFYYSRKHTRKKYTKYDVTVEAHVKMSTEYPTKVFK